MQWRRKLAGVLRNKEPDLQWLRRLVQSLFLLLILWIGWKFHHFVKFLEAGGVGPPVSRPPGVEGFLPISALMNFYYFFLTGEIHPVHPAALFILGAAVLMSLTFGKSFCGWVCPFGWLSEYLGRLGRRLFGRNLHIPRWLDYPLRSIKYLLLGFFLWVILSMSLETLNAYMNLPYNLVADIKMYYFFAHLSALTFWVLVILVLLSIVIKNFWCRYLCPYGALLGLAGLLSPIKIKRRESTCINCGKCRQACPMDIRVDVVDHVISDECTTCLACVDSCPVADTLYLELLPTKKRLNKKAVAVAVATIFLAVTGLGMLTGHWQNNITLQDYLRLLEHIDSYTH